MNPKKKKRTLELLNIILEDYNLNCPYEIYNIKNCYNDTSMIINKKVWKTIKIKGKEGLITFRQTIKS